MHSLEALFPINVRERSQVTKLGDLDALLFLFCEDLDGGDPQGRRAESGAAAAAERDLRALDGLQAGGK